MDVPLSDYDIAAGVSATSRSALGRLESRNGHLLNVNDSSIARATVRFCRRGAAVYRAPDPQLFAQLRSHLVLNIQWPTQPAFGMCDKWQVPGKVTLCTTLSRLLRSGEYRFEQGLEFRDERESGK